MTTVTLKIQPTKRSIALMSVPPIIANAFRKAYPEIEWSEYSAPQSADEWRLFHQEFQRPVTALCVAPLTYTLLPTFARRGWIKPLDGIIPPDVCATYVPAALKLSTVDETLYAAPEDVSSFLFAMRADAFRKLKLKTPLTWNLWKSLARLNYPILCKAEGKGIAGWKRLFLSLLGANGGEPSVGWEQLSNLKTPALETYEFLQQAGGQKPLDVSLDTIEDLCLGRIACGFVDTGSLAKLPPKTWANLQLFPLPSGNSDRKPLANFYGSGWVIPRNAVAPDLAIEILKTLSNTELFVERELRGGWAFPAVTSVWKDSRIRARFPFYKDAPVLLGNPRMIEHARLDDELWDTVTECVQEALSEGLDAAAWWERVLSRRLHIAKREVGQKILQKAVDYIEAHLDSIQGIRSVGAAVSRHHDYVNHLFRKHLKISCGEYIRQRRMTRARDLLGNMTLSIKEISAAVGMRNASSFGRSFRDFWGCNATVLRAKLVGSPHYGAESSALKSIR